MDSRDSIYGIQALGACMGEWGVAVPRIMGARTISFVAAGDVADFGEVEVDIALFVVGEERVERVGVVLLVETGRLGNVQGMSLLVDAEYAVLVDFRGVEHVAQFVGNEVF